MIYLYTGKPRTGKTHEMVRMVYNIMKKEKNTWLWVNRPLGQTLRYGKEISERSHMFDELNELNKLISWMEEKKITSSIVMIDEGQAYINARKWDELSEEIQYLLQTHGHYSIDIMMTSQHESRLDIVARQLVNYLYRMKCLKFKLGKWLLVFIGKTELDTDYMDKEDKEKIGWSLHIRTPWSPVLYDTHAKMEFPKKKNVVEHKFIKCQDCGHEKKIN